MVSSFLLHHLHTHTNIIVNRQRHHNIRIGILWAQTGHSTNTCTVSLHVIELCTHQKFESFNSNLLISSKNPEIVRNYFPVNGTLTYYNII